MQEQKNNIVGTEHEIAGRKWIVLEKTDNGYLCITEAFVKICEFDVRTNDWKDSELRKWLNEEFIKELDGVNIVPFERDLISLDGQTEYGKCVDSISLLTQHEYQRNRANLPNTGSFWWLVTPWSTPCNGYKYPVAVVAPSGGIPHGNFCFNDDGVRPVCIFPPCIFES